VNQRIIDFINALRAAGVRVSLAESADALRALEHTGIVARKTFRLALKTTLVKEAADGAKFDELFPLYFGSGGPPLQPPQLTPEQQQMLRDALRQLAGQLADLLRRLMEGRDLSQEELRQLGELAGLPQASSQYQRQWITRRMLRELGLNEIEDLLRALWAELAARGMTPEAIQELQGQAQANRDALEQQVDQYVGQQIARRQAEETRRRPSAGELMHRRFDMLDESEMRVLRDEVRRLAARLRTRIALRRRRGQSGLLDPKATLRANQRYGGVPLELRFKRRRRKARLVLICDLSTSMRPVVEFLLHLVYELHDQVAHTRTFIFIDHLKDVTPVFAEKRLQEAIDDVLQSNPPGHYNTDLGQSLAELVHERLDALERRTTVILLGDGRNNYNDPRLDAFEMLKRHARRMIWLTPESPGLWGEGDSDMPRYAPLCDSVHQVANLAQLIHAVDKILAE
jgi:uncharacterized protein with von Willebrand factor type A (vWA) domain